MPPVSIVIPAYNPQPYLLEAIASARTQTCGNVEIVLVNDGTDTAEGSELLRAAIPTVDRYIEQSNRGLAAARNTGFRAASSNFVIPLDADDLLDPNYAAVCMAVAAQYPAAAFVYTGCEVFGTESYVESAPPYNLYRLVDRNSLTCTALIRRSDWETAGGYDESMRGYADWEFWLRLGSLNRFGRPAPGVLFRYRKHGPSMLAASRANHQAITAYIRTKHSELYSEAGQARLKARWEPAVCVIAEATEGEATEQTAEDCTFLRQSGETPPQASAFLVPDPAKRLDPNSGECALLAVWGGRSPVHLSDGSVASSSDDFSRGVTPSGLTPSPAPSAPRHFQTLRSHLENAGLLSVDAWLRHPARSALRLVPLRWKEGINRALGRQFFDLSFYLRFQPGSVALSAGLMEPLQYRLRRKKHGRRVALVTPHLGSGGAERVLMDIAGALDRSEFEILLIAVDSRNDLWADRWRRTVDHVYDLAALVLPEKLPAALYSIVANWKPDTVLIQNSLVAYAVAPHLRRQMPAVRLLDLVHSVDADWNILAATRLVAKDLDLRVAVSETVRRRLIESGEPAGRTLVARSGIDLERFDAITPLRQARPFRILFAGRLDPVKRPAMLVRIAGALRRHRPSADFRFAVAGEGPEGPALSARVTRAGLAELFEFHGHVSDIAPLLADCDLLVLPSRAEGIPLVILEAFAASRPVIASSVGAVPEIVSEHTGVLVPLGAGEVEAFAAGIDGLLRDPERRRAMGENGRRLVAADYTLDAARRTYRGLFEPNARFTGCGEGSTSP